MDVLRPPSRVGLGPRRAHLPVELSVLGADDLDEGMNKWTARVTACIDAERRRAQSELALHLDGIRAGFAEIPFRNPLADGADYIYTVVEIGQRYCPEVETRK